MMHKNKPFTPNRRHFLIGAAAASGLRAVPHFAARLGRKRVLKLVYDKAAGELRAIDRVVR